MPLVSKMSYDIHVQYLIYRSVIYLNRMVHRHMFCRSVPPYTFVDRRSWLWNHLHRWPCIVHFDRLLNLLSDYPYDKASSRDIRYWKVTKVWRCHWYVLNVEPSWRDFDVWHDMDPSWNDVVRLDYQSTCLDIAIRHCCRLLLFWLGWGIGLLSGGKWTHKDMSNGLLLTR